MAPRKNNFFHFSVEKSVEESLEKETETAVLKLPPNLGDKLNLGNGKNAENKIPGLEVKDYENEVDFPDDTEKRGQLNKTFLFIISKFTDYFDQTVKESHSPIHYTSFGTSKDTIGRLYSPP